MLCETVSKFAFFGVYVQRDTSFRTKMGILPSNQETYSEYKLKTQGRCVQDNSAELILNFEISVLSEDDFVDCFNFVFPNGIEDFMSWYV